MRQFLNPIEYIYKLGFDLHKSAYKYSFLKEHKLNVPVICIGNLTMGGTGKTPIVEYTANYLHELGKHPAILSRGYKGNTQSSQSHVVTDGNTIISSPDQCGDEPYLLAQNTNGIIIIVNKNRYLGGQLAIGKFGCDVIVMDDGFQHHALKKDCSIVVIDSTNPFGNGRLIPLGILREPIDALSRANAVILTHVPFAKNLSEIKDKIKSVNPNIPIIESVHMPDSFVDLNDKSIIDLSDIMGKKTVSLSAIGNPKNFNNTLTDLGIDVVHSLEYRDHYFYNDNDVNEISQACEKYKPDYLITTQKDAIKFESLNIEKINCPFIYLKIKIEFLNNKDILNELIKKYAN